MFGSYVPRIYARLNGRKCNDASLKDTPRYKSMVNICNKFDLKWTSWVDEIHKSVGSVGDVSQIFMQFALPANTKDKLIQEYMYEYFMGLYGRIPNKFATSIFKDLDDTITSYGSKQGQTIRIVDKAYTQQISFSALGYLDIEGTIGDVGAVQSGRGFSNVTVGRSIKNIFHRPSIFCLSFRLSTYLKVAHQFQNLSIILNFYLYKIFFIFITLLYDFS